jgi:hypothetical protein
MFAAVPTREFAMSGYWFSEMLYELAGVAAFGEALETDAGLGGDCLAARQSTKCSSTFLKP